MSDRFKKTSAGAVEPLPEEAPKPEEEQRPLRRFERRDTPSAPARPLRRFERRAPSPAPLGPLSPLPKLAPERPSPEPSPQVSVDAGAPPGTAPPQPQQDAEPPLFTVREEPDTAPQPAGAEDIPEPEDEPPKGSPLLFNTAGGVKALMNVGRFARGVRNEAVKGLARGFASLGITVGGTIPEAIGAFRAEQRNRAINLRRDLEAAGFDLPEEEKPAQIEEARNALQGQIQFAEQVFGGIRDATSLQASPRTQKTWTQLFSEGDVQGFSEKLAGGVGEVAPSMAAAIAGFFLGGPLGAGVVGGSLEGSSQFEQALRKNKPPRQALEEAGVVALGTGVLNAIPFVRPLHKFLPPNKAGFAAALLLDAANEGVTETLEGGLGPIAELEDFPETREEFASLLEDVWEGIKAESTVFPIAALTGTGITLATRGVGKQEEIDAITAMDAIVAELKREEALAEPTEEPTDAAQAEEPEAADKPIEGQRDAEGRPSERKAPDEEAEAPVRGDREQEEAEPIEEVVAEPEPTPVEEQEDARTQHEREGEEQAEATEEEVEPAPEAEPEEGAEVAPELPQPVQQGLQELGVQAERVSVERKDGGIDDTLVIKGVPRNEENDKVFEGKEWRFFDGAWRRKNAPEGAEQEVLNQLKAIEGFEPVTPEAQAELEAPTPRSPETTPVVTTEQTEQEISETIDKDYQDPGTQLELRQESLREQTITGEKRDRAGLANPSSKETISWKESNDKASELGLAKNALAKANQVNSSPEILDDVQTAGLNQERDRLVTDNDKAIARMAEAEAKGDEALIQSISSEMNLLESQFDEITRAIDVSGSPLGRALAFRKSSISDSYDSLSVRARARAAKFGSNRKKGQKLSQKELATFDGLTEALSERTKDVRIAKDEEFQERADRHLRNKSSPVSKRFARLSPSETEAELKTLETDILDMIKKGCNS